MRMWNVLDANLTSNMIQADVRIKKGELKIKSCLTMIKSKPDRNWTSFSDHY